MNTLVTVWLFIIKYKWMESSKLCYIIRSGHSLLDTTFSVSMGFLFVGVYRMLLTIRIALLKISFNTYDYKHSVFDYVRRFNIIF